MLASHSTRRFRGWVRSSHTDHLGGVAWHDRAYSSWIWRARGKQRPDLLAVENVVVRRERAQEAHGITRGIAESVRHADRHYDKGARLRPNRLDACHELQCSVSEIY